MLLCFFKKIRNNFRATSESSQPTSDFTSLPGSGLRYCVIRTEDFLLCQIGNHSVSLFVRGRVNDITGLEKF